MRPLPAALYALAAAAAAPGLRCMLHRRARRGREISNRLPERRGIEPAPRPPGRLVWLHAASVGESLSALPVAACLAAAGSGVLFTTGTAGAAQVLEGRLPPGVFHRFAPLDVPAWAARFLDHWRPDAAAFVESELWPNLLVGCRRRGIPFALLNARLSARAARRWGRLPGCARWLLDGFAWIAARSEADAVRLRALGATRVSTPGDLKLAAPPLPADESALAGLRAALGDRPRWLAASTHAGEEAIAARLHARLAPRHPGLVTIVAPRHAARGRAIADALAAPRRGAGPPPGGLWIADTMGELGLFYQLCPVAIVGNSLSPPGGGHNPLEPARLGRAVAYGPHMGNFAEAAALLEAAGAARRLESEAAAFAFLDAMLADPAAVARMGAAGRAAASALSDLPSRLAAGLLALAAA